ncbi:prephenate dehydratase [Cutibacterium sp. WCA-380-WT-3A]|uniref:Prephenate dehydratase n=1 Tax=Cutibacterium porci TaxID=2605781 RepID=A0A7K0J3L7_9ACTN|nr:prephenate dehydratase [Cutibacterium porci]MSS44516.1 prephenate dehydratase [Cutibacterium porci]
MYGYFGPAGTFTHQALKTLDYDDARPYATVGGALQGVVDGDVEASLVPIENSVEGGVSATLDTLAVLGGLQIVREVVIPVQFNVYVRPGTSLSSIRHVLTHPHAANQCREWLAANLSPHAEITQGGSTAAAAKEVSDPRSRFDAAVCAEVAGTMYGLTAVAQGIADNPDAVTRFILVARNGQMMARTGDDRTTVVVVPPNDHPGALLEILQQFSFRKINLSRIESRPTKDRLGEYCFSIDAIGHIEDARMAAALKGLYRISRKVIFLGSYPNGFITGSSPSEGCGVGCGFRDEDYAAAEEWFARVTGK